jgi:hypothetical protein
MRRLLPSLLCALILTAVASYGLAGPAAAAAAVQNPSLEVDANGDGVPDCWQLAGYGTNSATWARVTGAHSGSYAERVKLTSWASGDRKLLPRLDTGTCAPAATAGHTYRLQSWYQATVTTSFVAFVRSTAGSWRYWTTGPAQPAAAGWTLASWTTPALPSDATAISFGLTIGSVGSLTVDDVTMADTTAAPPPATPSSTVLLRDQFDVPDSLLTNEYAYWNPGLLGAVVSPVWEMTSGSLFARSGAGWSGTPDAIGPNALSTNGTDSAIFRLTTKRADFGDVSVGFALRNDGLSSTAVTPPVDWDGIHIFLRYQSQYSLYYASINRRDNTVAIKKKVPGGPSNGGTYYTLAVGTHAVPYGAWQQVRATVHNESNGSVTIRLYGDGQQVVAVTDNGAIGGPPITAPGKVGIRGDNCNFQFDDFTVQSL